LKRQFSRSYNGLFLIAIIVGNIKVYYGANGDTSGATDDDDDNDSCCLLYDAQLAADPFVDLSSYGYIKVVHIGNGQEDNCNGVPSGSSPVHPMIDSKIQLGWNIDTHNEVDDLSKIELKFERSKMD